MARKVLVEGLPSSTPDLEEKIPIFLLTKETKIARGPTIDKSKFAPGFMLNIDFSFFNVESICGYASNFVDMCSTI